MESRQNNFNIIRFVAAIMVMAGHMGSLTGTPPLGFLGLSINAEGIAIFFLIGGYLITKSWLADPHPLRYAVKAKPTMKGGVNELAYLRLRYKQPNATTSELIEVPLHRAALKPLAQTDEDFRFAAAVAAYGQLLRGGTYTGQWTYADTRRLAGEAIGKDRFGYRGEFLRLIDLAQSLSTPQKP